jgi:hypothetical protein
MYIHMYIFPLKISYGTNSKTAFEKPTQTMNIVAFQETVVLPANLNNNFLGIPLELPVEVKRKAQADEANKGQPASTFKVYRNSAEEFDTPTSRPIQSQPQPPAPEEEPTTVQQTSSEDSAERFSYASSAAASDDYAALPRPVARPPRPDARPPSQNYISRIFQFFGGPKSNPPQPPRVLRKRINA